MESVIVDWRKLCTVNWMALLYAATKDKCNLATNAKINALVVCPLLLVESVAVETTKLCSLNWMAVLYAATKDK
jgi:hypothetical protein